jgi:hypothetical protein
LIVFCNKAWGVTYIDHANVQYAGELGLFSMGLGRQFARYSIGGMYGFVPSGMAGGTHIETIAIRQTYSFFQGNKIGFYGGLNIFHVLSLQYETAKYGDSPERYYPIGSIRGLLNLGSSFGIDRGLKTKIYFEAGLNDLWIVNYLTNRDVINPTNHISLGIGLKHTF